MKKQASSKKFVKPYKPASFEILWPNLKLTGSYQRAELTKDKGGSFSIGGEGKLAAEFAPLIGLTGKIDLMQYFLMTLGGAFGAFLRKIAKLSIGKKDEFGELDKKSSYIQTNLELLLGFKSEVGGNLTFTNLNGKWKGSEGSGVTGFIGMIFEGKAKVDGKVWRVTFGAGAEFKTTDEGGTKNCGIEVSLKSVAIDNRFAIVGLTEFTGLAITWAFYSNVGAENESENYKKNNKGKRGLTKTKKEIKESGKHILFKKRELFKSDSPTPFLSN